MSSNWNFPLIGINEDEGTVSSTSLPTAVTNSYTQLVAATAYEWCGFHLIYDATSTTQHSVTLGLGSAGNEFALIADLLTDCTSGTILSEANLFCPLRVPAGTRIAAKTSSASGGNMSLVGMAAGASGGVACGSFCEFAGTAGTGVTVDCGAVANTKGAWTQITASTTYPWRGFFLSISDAGTISANQPYLIDIGIGGAGSEQAILSNHFVRINANHLISNPWRGPFLCDIPAGTRIAARGQTNNTTSTHRSPAINVHGIVG